VSAAVRRTREGMSQRSLSSAAIAGSG
jgi:hypothetical protein